MSSSRIASMRFQSVLDCVFVFFPLFMICLPQRDDADYIVRAWRECYKGDAALNRANPDPSSFAIVLTGVGTNEKKTAEHFFRLREVDAVLPDIGSILGFVLF